MGSVRCVPTTYHLRAESLEQLLGVRKARGTHIPRTGRSYEEPPGVWGPAHRSVGSSVLLMTFPRIGEKSGMRAGSLSWAAQGSGRMGLGMLLVYGLG